MMVEKWYRPGETELYTRQQVRDLIGRTKLTDGQRQMLVRPYAGKGNSFWMDCVSVVKGTRYLEEATP